MQRRFPLVHNDYCLSLLAFPLGNKYVFCPCTVWLFITMLACRAICCLGFVVSLAILHSTLYKTFCVIFRNNSVFHFRHDSTVCNNPVAPDMLVEVSYVWHRLRIMYFQAMLITRWSREMCSSTLYKNKHSVIHARCCNCVLVPAGKS